MNRRILREFAARTRGMGMRDKLAVARMVAEEGITGPLSDEERSLSAAILARLGPGDWYHGGLPGLRQGDELRPAHVTGSDPRGMGGAVPDRARHVFITRDRALAGRYAELARGVIYAVQPLGRIDVDPMELRTFRLVFLSDKRGRDAVAAGGMGFIIDQIAPHIHGFTCDAARVLSVHQISEATT